MTQLSRKELLDFYKQDFLDSLRTLNHSYIKVKDTPIPDASKDLDELEKWEAFTSRFARCTDIFLSKYLRLLILELDPGFRGEMRDYLDKAEKSGLILDADKWMKIRELRNKIAHEYTKEDLVKTLEDVFNLTEFTLHEFEKFKEK